MLGNAESLVGESFSEAGVVGPPMYTRPAEWDGEEVPGVLLSGNHAQIRAWRERESRGQGAGEGDRTTVAPDIRRFTHERSTA